MLVQAYGAHAGEPLEPLHISRRPPVIDNATLAGQAKDASE